MVNMYKRMLFYFLAYICLWEVPTSHAYSFGGIAVKPELRNRIARPIPLTHTCLLAKKKGSKLISDDLFSSLYDEEGSTANSTPQPVVSKETAFANTVTKDKKKKHKLVSDDLLKSIVSEEANAPRGEQITPSPPPHQQKTVEPTKITEGADSERSVAPAAEVPTKARKDKPSSRIRFVESSQPDFVSLGLDKASVTFGDDVVVKDATFSVSTGERVGLVGPNGAGKVSVICILPCSA
jgi:ABC-type multidrug transport system fused ATPase/permease subunit